MLNKYIILWILLLVIVYFVFNNSENFTDENKNINIKKHKFDDYEVLEIENLLSAKECDEIINFTTNKGMEQSTIFGENVNDGLKINTDYRNSLTTWIKDEELPLANKISEISVDITKLPKINQEFLQVVKYDEGGTFKPHYDACLISKEYCDKMNGSAGERRSTLLIYLNDDFEGGETEFVKLNLKIKPKKGKAILFWSTDENGNLFEKSLHTGHIVKNGNKWIATKWSHNNSYLIN